MRASYYQGNRTFRTGFAAMPAPAPAEALLRVRRVGICDTDLHIYQGHLDHRVPKNGIIGHEVFAEVMTAPAGSGSPPAIASSWSPCCSAEPAAPAAWARHTCATT